MPDYLDHDFDFPASSWSSPTQHPVLDYGDSCFLLKGVFTPRECRTVIDEAEGLGFQDTGFGKSYRDSDRIIIRSFKLRDLLWERVRPFIQPLDIEDPKSSHVYTHQRDGAIKGRWIPDNLNEVFRICRYFEGGHFSPHYDGIFARNENDRSFKTFMIYLNDLETDDDDGDGNFGGATNFLDERAPSETLSGEKRTMRVLYQVRPEAGMALVFNHARLHEGEPLKKGRKYILRTDAMFKREAKWSQGFVGGLKAWWDGNG